MKVLVAILNDLPARVVVADNSKHLLDKLEKWYFEVAGLSREELEEGWKEEVNEEQLFAMENPEFFGDWTIYCEEV